ncbi:MAG: hypothetical protein ABL933_02685 [Methyloglobulus sp.]|nr:hypothetical protein [Methyloglobulus sp.]
MGELNGQKSVCSGRSQGSQNRFIIAGWLEKYKSVQKGLLTVGWGEIGLALLKAMQNNDPKPLIFRVHRLDMQGLISPSLKPLPCLRKPFGWFKCFSICFFEGIQSFRRE